MLQLLQKSIRHCIYSLALINTEERTGAIWSEQNCHVKLRNGFKRIQTLVVSTESDATAPGLCLPLGLNPVSTTGAEWVLLKEAMLCSTFITYCTISIT